MVVAVDKLNKRTPASGEIKATNYVLIFADLRNLNVVENKLLNFGFDPSYVVWRETYKIDSKDWDWRQEQTHSYNSVVMYRVIIRYRKPVLILSECVLVYLDTTSSSALIRWFATKCEQAMFLLYEQIKPYTPFGQQMIKNLMVSILTLFYHLPFISDVVWNKVFSLSL